MLTLIKNYLKDGSVKLCNCTIRSHSSVSKSSFKFITVQDEKSTERLWLNKMITGGTAADKISAMQIFIQRSPVHALSHIDGLVTIVAKKNTREAFALLSSCSNFVTNVTV